MIATSAQSPFKNALDSDDSEPPFHPVQIEASQDSVPDSAVSITETQNRRLDETDESTSDISPMVGGESLGNIVAPPTSPATERPNTEAHPDKTLTKSDSFTIDPTDQARYPYVDEDGWRQLSPYLNHHLISKGNLPIGLLPTSQRISTTT